MLMIQKTINLAIKRKTLVVFIENELFLFFSVVPFFHVALGQNYYKKPRNTLQFIIISNCVFIEIIILIICFGFLLLYIKSIIFIMKDPG